MSHSALSEHDLAILYELRGYCLHVGSAYVCGGCGDPRPCRLGCEEPEDQAGWYEEPLNCRTEDEAYEAWRDDGIWSGGRER